MTTLTKTQTQTPLETDLLYNRQIAAAVLSWDTGCYNAPGLHIHPDDITGISIQNDVVFYQVNYTHAVPLLIEDFHRYWDAVQEYRQQQDQAEIEVKRKRLERTVQPLKNYKSAVKQAVTIGTHHGVAFNWVKPDGENETTVWASRNISPLFGLAPFCFLGLDDYDCEVLMEGVVQSQELAF